MAEGGVSRVVARPLSLEEQLSKFPAELLDSLCVDAHLVKLTECFSDWQTGLSTSLELTAVEVKDIEEEWQNPARRRVEMFRRWRNKLASQATYRCVPVNVIKLPTLDEMECLFSRQRVC